MSLIAVVEHLTEENRKAIEPTMSADDFFELFVSDLVTRDYGLNWEDIESGVVNGQNDGQLDAVYILIDDQIVREKKEFDAKSSRRNVVVRVLILQSKNKNSFEENSFSKLRASISDLFDLSKKLKSFAKVYNEDVITQADLFRHVYLGLQGKNPKVFFDVVFASKGDSKSVNARIKSDDGAIRKFFKKEFYRCEATTRFLGARELIDLANRPRFINKELNFTVPPTSDQAASGWVGLVRLDEFFKFITDENKKLLSSMLEENVRDFEGDKGVNKEISETLSTNDVDFWWLNNGCTVLCDEALPHTQSQFSLDRPLIVNGLQTATKIWQHFSPIPNPADGRHILIRVIKSTDDVVRDRIIRATNRQTPIGPAQLKATHKLHRDIERFFSTRRKFYERRKNQYKNAGKKKKDIFSINEVAQGIISIALARPNDARARPSSLLNTDAGYDEVFNPKSALKLFAFCAETVREVEALLLGKTTSRKERNNLKFYIAFVISRLMCGKRFSTKKDLANLLGSKISQKVFDKAYDWCRSRYNKLGGDDDAARGSGLIAKIIKDLPKLLKANKKFKV